MKLATLFIRDTQAFEVGKQEIEKTFLINECLPERVFREDFGWFAFEEFDWAMSGEFWPVIQELAQASGDTSLLMAVLDPEPEDYFKKEFGYYNWANIPISASRDDYWELLNAHPESSPADSFLANSEKVVWLSHSAKWAIWGERSYGVCVLAACERMQIGSWHDVDWALKHYLPNSFKNRVVPAEFAASLRLNFGTSR
jgi:hypothetical protein